ncbi:hypothetical protein Pmani_034636 [Petrolisthes manimaculis]|uniref:Uncharacterized protein n=1 Tax=Petrolisthes manimaculis TaxID=1843537 RepID=A0AAE1NNY8_9EUCA|nr:hypothetical protein Pmani_034636 [Petrolisthes manimaculis]
MMAQDDQQDDQTSDTSNESTETAIYLDNVSPPPPPSLNMKAQQLHEDTTKVLLSSGAQKYKARRLVHTLVDDLTPAATSSPITSRRRRTRFPYDFLWQGGSRRL